MKKSMKTLGLILVLSAGILVMTLALLPLSISTTIQAYPQSQTVTAGQLRVGQITVDNDGLFARNVKLPEVTGCVGDIEVPLDMWTVSESALVRGAGRVPYIKVKPGEQGTVYLIARDITLNDHLLLFYRTPYFSCLTPGNAIQSEQ